MKISTDRFDIKRSVRKLSDVSPSQAVLTERQSQTWSAMCIVFKSILACILPPLAVLVDQGCTGELCLNLLLTLLGYFPGCIHAYCVICRPEPHYIQGHATTIVNVSQAPPPQTIYVQPMGSNQMMQPPNQLYSPGMAGHMAYPMAPHQQMSAPPAYDNPSPGFGNDYNFKEKFNE